jgi:hypothetical protein
MTLRAVDCQKGDQRQWSLPSLGVWSITSIFSIILAGQHLLGATILPCQSTRPFWRHTRFFNPVDLEHLGIPYRLQLESLDPCCLSSCPDKGPSIQPRQTPGSTTIPETLGKISPVQIESTVKQVILSVMDRKHRSGRKATIGKRYGTTSYSFKTHFQIFYSRTASNAAALASAPRH